MQFSKNQIFKTQRTADRRDSELDGSEPGLVQRAPTIWQRPVYQNQRKQHVTILLLLLLRPTILVRHHLQQPIRLFLHQTTARLCEFECVFVDFCLCFCVFECVFLYVWFSVSVFLLVFVFVYFCVYVCMVFLCVFVSLWTFVDISIILWNKWMRAISII